VASHREPFRLNRDEGKVLGVCAGIADHFDADVTLVRAGMVLAILITFPLMLVGYFLLAMIARSDRGRVSGRAQRAPRLADPAADTRERMRALDARMQAIESYVTSPNTALAREIEDLR